MEISKKPYSGILRKGAAMLGGIVMGKKIRNR